MIKIIQIALGDHHRSEMDLIKALALSSGYEYELITHAPAYLAHLPVRLQADHIKIGLLATVPYVFVPDTDCVPLVDTIELGDEPVFFSALLDNSPYNGNNTAFFMRVLKRLAHTYEKGIPQYLRAEEGMIYHATIAVLREDFNEFLETCTLEQTRVIDFAVWLQTISYAKNWVKYGAIKHLGLTMNRSDEEQAHIINDVIDSKVK